MEWIPVDKKAPEIGQRIIYTGIRGLVSVGFYKGAVEGWQGRIRHVVAQCKSSTKSKEFEAWMPAPEPYKDLKKYEELTKLRADYYAYMAMAKRRGALRRRENK